MRRKQTTKDELALAIGVKSPIEREVLEQLSGFGINSTNAVNLCDLIQQTVRLNIPH